MTSKPSVGASDLNIDGQLGCLVCNTAYHIKILPSSWRTSCKKWGQWGASGARLDLACVDRWAGSWGSPLSPVLPRQ